MKHPVQHSFKSAIAELPSYCGSIITKHCTSNKAVFRNVALKVLNNTILFLQFAMQII